MPETIREVQTFLLDVKPLFQSENYQRLYDRMPDFRKEKADRLRCFEDKARSVGAWYLRMLAEARYGEMRCGEMWYGEMRCGEVRCGEIGESACNLSHSGDYALCSVGPPGAQVGCDVEMIKDFREPIARRFFAGEEYRHLMDREEEERAEWFYRYWVLKESFIKATRRGMALGLDRFSFAFNKEGTPYLIRQPEEAPGRYFFREYEAPGARIAVCSTCDRFAGDVTVCDLRESEIAEIMV